MREGLRDGAHDSLAGGQHAADLRFILFAQIRRCEVESVICVSDRSTQGSPYIVWNDLSRSVPTDRPAVAVSDSFRRVQTGVDLNSATDRPISEER